MSEGGDISRLIGELGADLKPVRRLPPPWLRALVWLGVVLVVALILVATRTLLPALGIIGNDPFMLPGAYASLATAALAAIAAFELSLPDRSDWWALLPVPALLVWIALNGLGCLATLAIPGTETSPFQFMVCLGLIFAISLPLTAAMLLMLRRARPLRPLRVGILGGLAASAAAATLLILIHPHDSAVLDLAAHAVAVAIIIGLNTLLGGRLLVPANKFRRAA
ncbi:MAG: NrsF family protein [Devosia sp.]